MKTTVENSERLDRQGTLGKFLMSTPERNARICVDYLLKGKSLIILNKLSWLVMNYAPDWLKTRLISEASKKRYWNNILNIKSNAKNCFIKRMKNIFISGISGLLGTNLVNILLEQGYKVTGVIRNPDNFTGTRNENLTLLKGGLLTIILLYFPLLTSLSILLRKPNKTSFGMKNITKPISKPHVIYMKLP